MCQLTTARSSIAHFLDQICSDQVLCALSGCDCVCRYHGPIIGLWYVAKFFTQGVHNKVAEGSFYFTLFCNACRHKLINLLYQPGMNPLAKPTLFTDWMTVVCFIGWKRYKIFLDGIDIVAGVRSSCRCFSCSFLVLLFVSSSDVILYSG